MGMKDWYERHVFSRVLDWAMRQMDDERGPTLAEARGDVLEVGFGTGLNLAHYPEGVAKLVTVDPLVALRERVEARIAAAPFPVERHALRADGGLPFDAGRFDRVVVTWTLCSIPDPERALAEMRRVLKPEGSLLFIEHGRSEDAGVARWQERLDPLWKRLAGGCHMSRSPDRLIEEAGFRLEGLERWRNPDEPRVLAELYRGRAVPA
jgi:SAM-dependent methyltransferase